MRRTWILTLALGVGILASASCSSSDNAGSPADAGPDASPVDAAIRGQAFFLGSDFKKAELSVFNVGPNDVAGRLAIADQDTLPAVTGGTGFALEQMAGKVIVLDRAQPWTAHATIDVNDVGDAGSADPTAVVVAAGNKAYVARYHSNVAKIIDIAAGTVIGSLDFTPFLAAGDPDGWVDLQDALFDARTQRVYFLLERFNQNDIGAGPDYVGECLSSINAQIVAVNVGDDRFVDLHGADGGAITDAAAIDLQGRDPVSISSSPGGDIIVVDAGCYVRDASGQESPHRAARGVEKISQGSAKATWLYQTTDTDRLSALVWADATHAFLNKGTNWYSWDPSQSALGPVIDNFPQAPFYDGRGHVIGLVQSSAVADAAPLWSVVSYDVQSGHISPMAVSPFQDVMPKLVYSAYLPLSH